MPPEISIVTPVYLAADCLHELVRRLSDVLQGSDYEIVLVDDGSADASGTIIEELAARDPRVIGLLLSRNFGQHAAIHAGIAESRGDSIVVMDCDLQDRPEDIPALRAKLAEGYDVVIARRADRTTSLFKRWSSRAWFAILNRMSGTTIEPGSGSFSILTRAVADALLRMPNRHTHYQLVLRWVGFRQTYVPVQDGGRFAGRSAYSLRRLLSHAASGLVAHSTRLLHFSIYTGFVFVFLSVLQFAYVVFHKVAHGVDVAGWTSLMATMWLIGGAILFSLGVIGLYLGRIVDDVKQRPPYIVRRRLRADAR